jgi:hypothetical protein
VSRKPRPRPRRPRIAGCRPARPPNDDAPRVALVLDAGGARSAYQVGALEVLLPALAERGTAAPLLIGTSAGALLTGALSATAHLEPDDQIARLNEHPRQTTKQNVMRPLWRQVPEVLVRYASETLGLPYFRLRGLFGSQPLAQTLATSIDWEALHRNVEDRVIESAAVTATAVRTGRVIVFTESGSPVPRSAPEYHGRFVATRLDVPPPDGLRGDPRSVPLRAHRRARRSRGVVRRRRHPPSSAARSGSRAWCRSRGCGRHRRTAPARCRPRLGPGRRRPGRRRGLPCSARSWTTRCDTTCGGSRSSTR